MLSFYNLLESESSSDWTSNYMPHTRYVMSWDRTERVLRFYMFGKDSASAYVLRHQMSTVLEFQTRGRQGFRGSDEEFEGQSMSISDWGTYMRFGTYKYWRESCQGSGNWAYSGSKNYPNVWSISTVCFISSWINYVISWKYSHTDYSILSKIKM